MLLDNHCTHKSGRVRAWLEMHPRWIFHPIPASSSWRNAVQERFTKQARRRLRKDVVHSVGDLQDTIDRFIAEHDTAAARPLVWRADPADVMPARNAEAEI